MATTPYCVEDDIADRLSESGIALRIDDVPPRALGNAISRASSKVNGYLLKGYDPTALAGSDWVTEVAANIATYYLCTRRGNPAPGPIAEAFRADLEDLQLIRKGEMDVPDAPRRRQSCPVMSNVHTPLSPQPHVRVSRKRSTTTGGAPSGYQQVKDLSEVTESYMDYPMGS